MPAPERPVAILHLDTRAHGPYFCENCEAENEDAILMSDASVVCPECKTALEAFKMFSDGIVSVSTAKASSSESKKEKWIIEYTDIDSSRDATVAYDSRAKAIEAAFDFVRIQAQDEHSAFVWEQHDEAPKKLLKILEDVKAEKKDAAIVGWLEYQSEFDPQEKIALGPSGSVSDRAHDFQQ